jgi:hypothetical protein
VTLRITSLAEHVHSRHDAHSRQRGSVKSGSGRSPMFIASVSNQHRTPLGVPCSRRRLHCAFLAPEEPNVYSPGFKSTSHSFRSAMLNSLSL